ncbi:MAG TPA: Na+/H+ antiporter NhaC family protein [Longimicrobiales bacterium]|nr:Na+/H+ antiporter NhaC family protein [Longimicrobiales bacterium]
MADAPGQRPSTPRRGNPTGPDDALEAMGMEGEPMPQRPTPGKRLLFATALVVAIALLAWLFGPQGTGAPAAAGEHYGFASVLPALLTLVLVFVTREVISSLFIGIFVGGVVSGNWNIIQVFLLPAIGSQRYAVILLVYLWALGGLIGLWTRTGGAQHFARWAGQRIVRGPRTAKFFAWLMGMVFHQGGTISTILAGTTVRPVTDAERVSHEEVSYLVDSTASPAATIIPLNAWPLYVSGLVAGTTPLFATEQEAVTFFFRSVPFNFYGIFAVMLTFLFAWEWLPWEGGKMRRARQRARDTGQLNAPGAKPLAADELTELHVPETYRTGLEDFLVPLGVLVGVALTGVVPGLLAGDLSAISVPIEEAFGLSVLSAVLLALLQGMSVQETVDGFVDGCKGVTIGAIILGLAVTLGDVSGFLGTASYIVEHTADLIIPAILPALFLAIGMAIAFSIGSSWGTYAVLFPIAMPLAYAVSPDPFYMTLCFGATLGGAVFGDQCSPISDTTILSALATGSDLMDHVTTQLPLAMAAAGMAAILYTILAMGVV